MDVRTSYTFLESLDGLTGDEQKAAKIAAFELQVRPDQPGFQFHRLDKVKDKNFWSARVSGDIRFILHRIESSLLLCYVGHHDDAYDWARRHKLETHPTTGAAQLVELRETVQEIIVPKYVEVEIPAPPKPRLFASRTEADLLACGVPTEWLDDVRNADEDSLLGIAAHLPAEAAEALLDLATGTSKPRLPHVAAPGTNPFDHPDAQRRFRVMRNVEELERALDYPWERWTVFLHPAQRQLVERDFNGPARVSGSAGTGKTIVALHRAAALARAREDSRILLTTLSESLAAALRVKLQRLLGNEPRLAERVEVHSMEAVARRLWKSQFGVSHPPALATRDHIRSAIAESADAVPARKFTERFLLAEWNDIVDAWQLDSWIAYRDVPRLGRKTRLPETQRAKLWEMFTAVQAALDRAGRITAAAMFTRLAAQIRSATRSPFDYVVIDEAQDVSIAQLKFLAALGRNRPDALFFAGDLGQRIFQPPYSWKSLGVDIRGRSTTLKINYRTSHQIRSRADRLLEPSLADVDGNTEERKGTMSVFNGPDPVVAVHDTAGAEAAAVGAWLQARLTGDKLRPEEIGIFVRSEAELRRAHEAARQASLPAKTLDESVVVSPGHAAVGTMHLAKGLEFRAIVVMACDDEIIPSPARIETAADESELEEIYNTERHLLYVACTRARDYLLVSGVDPASEFLDDIRLAVHAESSAR